MAKVKSIVVGTGGMSRFHIRSMLSMSGTTAIVGFVEPAEKSREAVRLLFSEENKACPPFYGTIRQLLADQGAPDAAMICSPHKYHLENASDCLKAGMHVCLEKPMVMNTSEAQRLIQLRDKTGRIVVVAFPGSLSPAIEKAKSLIAKGTLGNVSVISAFVHQRWKQATTGAWRQVPEISGGGFLFDTGSHMVNTVVDLLGEDVARVTALIDNRGAPVEINSAVSGISRSGVMFSLTGAGDSIQCNSQITVFGDKAVLQTGIWGEYLYLKKLKEKEFTAVPYRNSRGPWEQFLAVVAGKKENPCPAEVGLRFARLMDMIRKSAETGQTVTAPRNSKK